MVVSSQADTLMLIVLEQADALKLARSLAAALLAFGPADDYVGGSLKSESIPPHRCLEGLPKLRDGLVIHCKSSDRLV